MTSLNLKSYPKPAETRTGIKVSWYYFDNESDAKACSEAARYNGAILAGQGYDFGYQAPGAIHGPGKQNFYPELWEVVIP